MTQVEVNTYVNPNALSPIQLKVIIITYRLEDNTHFRPTEETLLKFIFKAGGIKYEKRIFNREKIAMFYGRLPCIYVNGLILQNSSLITFVKDILIEKPQHENLLNLLEFILSSELKNLIELSYFLQKYEKLKNSKKIMNKLLPLVRKNIYYEKITSDYLNLNSANRQENITQNIIKNYNRIYSIFVKNNLLNLHKENTFSLIEAFFYSYIKEEKTLFTEINRPTLENIKTEEKIAFETFYTFYETFSKTRKDLKIQLKSEEEIFKICKKFVESKSTKKKDVKDKELTQFEKDSVFKYNIISIGFFIGISTLMFIYGSMRSNHKVKNN
jgi:hypothetical protein